MRFYFFLKSLKEKEQKVFSWNNIIIAPADSRLETPKEIGFI